MFFEVKKENDHVTDFPVLRVYRNGNYLGTIRKDTKTWTFYHEDSNEPEMTGESKNGLYNDIVRKYAH